MIPEEHKKFFKKTVEEHLEEFKKSTAQYRKSIRLLEKGQYEYSVIIISHWKNLSHHHEDEKDVEITKTGNVRDIIHEAEKQFMQINNRSDVQGTYAVGIKVGETVFSLPKKMWNKYKKRK